MAELRFLSRAGAYRLAYHRRDGISPGVIFLGGFRSSMDGDKALALEAHCAERRRAFVRFDYFGHGRSEGEFVDGTIGRWSEDAVAVLDEISAGPQLLVGSSMGGWIMLLAALARPERVAGLIGVAAAPDFTARLIEPQLDETRRAELAERGFIERASVYGDDPYPIARSLLDDGRRRLLLEQGKPIALDCPVRLLHGVRDVDVPWRLSCALLQQLRGDDVRLELIKDGEHRLSRPQDLRRLTALVDELAAASVCHSY